MTEGEKGVGGSGYTVREICFKLQKGAGLEQF